MSLFDWLRGGKTGQSAGGKKTGGPAEPAPPAGRGPNEGDDAELVNDAVRYIQQREMEQARRVLLDVITRAPAPGNYVHEFEADGKLHIKFWELTEFLAYVARMKSGEIPERDLVWLGNAYPRAYYYLGYLEIEDRNFQAALRYLDQGLLLDPACARLKCEKAQALIRTGRQREALQAYDEVLANAGGRLASSERALALRGRGYVLIDLDRLDEAEAVFQESLKFEPDSKVARDELAYIAQVRQRRQPQNDSANLAEALGISQDRFDLLYRSYEMALRMSGQLSHWNGEVDDLALRVGALTEEEIERAHRDFHQAVVNRIKLRLVMDRRGD
jgi:tetratricopeptide (TPR) repeat protein